MSCRSRAIRRSVRLLHAEFAAHDFLGPRISSASYPFKRPIGLRGKIAVFDADFCPSAGLAHDLEILNTLNMGLGTCAYGASDFPLYPFIGRLATAATELCAADVLTGLHAKNFQSDHIKDLRATSLHYPGYKPGTLNDEIHNDFESQYIFPNVTEDGGPLDPGEGTHGQLREYVRDGRLWYVLLHIDPFDYSTAFAPPNLFFSLLSAVRRTATDSSAS